jgi:hypothetical protein
LSSACAPAFSRDDNDSEVGVSASPPPRRNVPPPPADLFGPKAGAPAPKPEATAAGDTGGSNVIFNVVSSISNLGGFLS